MSTLDITPTKERWVSPLLALGIFIFPIGFFWLLLRTGYTKSSRVFAALWLIIWIFLIGNLHSVPREIPAPTKEIIKTDSVTSTVAGVSPHKVDDPKPDIAQTTREAIPTAPASAWSYSEDIDQMRGTKTRYASLVSDNSLYFEFPYAGGSTGNIIIRFRPKDGLNILLQISKGQFICNSYSGDRISIKFDKKPIQEFSCSSASDGSSNVIFIESSQRFLSEIKKSSTMIVEAPFYRAGNQQLKFSTSGLIWK